MSREVYRYRFISSADMVEVEASLLLALLATGSLHGESQVRLEAAHAWDAEGRTCVIDASSRVGRDLNRLFVGFLSREFGEEAFHVERMRHQPNYQLEEVTT